MALKKSSKKKTSKKALKPVKKTKHKAMKNFRKNFSELEFRNSNTMKKLLPKKKMQKSKLKRKSASKKSPIRKTPKPQAISKTTDKIKIKPIVETKTQPVQTLERTSLQAHEQEITLQPIVLKLAIPEELHNFSDEFSPNLDKLPPWESRQALKTSVFNNSLKFNCPSRASSEFQAVMALLNKSPSQDISGHFVVCMKSFGKVVGALDAYMIDDTLILGSSYVRTEKKREFQMLLYAAALTKYESKYVVCLSKISTLSPDFIGMLNLLGRGFGMYALQPINSTIVFVRRMNKEGPLSTGQEAAHILRSLRVFGNAHITSAVFEFSKKSTVALIQLPMSLTWRENLLELRDSISLLGFSVTSLDNLVPLLESLSYKDITPETLF
jgi:hypothetical protein